MIDGNMAEFKLSRSWSDKRNKKELPSFQSAVLVGHQKIRTLWWNWSYFMKILVVIFMALFVIKCNIFSFKFGT